MGEVARTWVTFSISWVVASTEWVINMSTCLELWENGEINKKSLVS
jgi:ammonia channel protein AmtB